MNILFIKRVYSLFSENEKYKVNIILVLSIITSIFETIGVFSIVPFMSLLTNPEYITDNTYFNNIANMYSLTLVESKVYFGILIIFLFIFSNLMNILTLWYTMNFIAAYQSRISTTVLKKYTQNSYNFFIKSDHSVLSKNILDESCILADGVVYALLQIITKSLIIIAISILMITMNPELFFGSIFLFTIIYLLIFVRYKKILFNIGVSRVEANNNRYKNTREVLSNIKDVKYYNLENIYIDNFRSSANNFAFLNAKRNLIGLLPRYFIEIITFGTIFTGIIYLIASNENLLLNIPMISMFLLAIYRIVPLLQNIFTNTANIKSSEYVFDNIKAIIDTDNYKRQSYTKINSFSNCIEFSNVSFGYDNNSYILQNVNLNISKGKTYAIVGETGIGKTTIIDLLLGFYKITSGKITIDGIQLIDNSFRSINHMIGYVSQNISYIADNIISNIIFSDTSKEVDMRKINKVVEVTQLNDVIDELEGGLYENIGDMGSMLSGGQKQRIGIARSLYREPEVLILDEATNALDQETEISLLNNIKRFYPNITLIMVTHRNTYLDQCDKIITVASNNISVTSPNIICHE